MKKAEFLCKLEGFTGDARLYRLTPPIEVKPECEDDPYAGKFRYVVVSATIALFSGPETYIFPADAKGNVLNWGELEGSYKGGLDHEGALKSAGYIVLKGKE